MKLTITINGKPVELTVEEARSLYCELKNLFESPQIVTWIRDHYALPVGDSGTPFVQPFTVTCQQPDPAIGPFGINPDSRLK